MTQFRTHLRLIDGPQIPAAFAGDADAKTPSRPGRDGPRFCFDLSRLASRVHHAAPTGVDRVEMAYATELSARLGDSLGFGLRHPCGLIGTVPRTAALAMLAAERAKWRTGRGGIGRSGAGHAAQALLRLMPRPAGLSEDTVLIVAGPANLDRPQRVAAMRRRLGGRLVALVHDLIPVTHPEYARVDGAARHARRLATLKAQAQAVLTNSAATAHDLAAYWQGDHPPIHAAPLGVAATPVSSRKAAPDRPYFLSVGTIEPRKNHLLLLNIWRRFADTLPAAEIPRLILAGRRGWENEMVLDMLDRCPALADHVEECGPASDNELAGLMAGARALLMPSFAEGFGLPVAEALAAGTPVIASDLPAHREIAGSISGRGATFLDPLDAIGWRDAILLAAERRETVAGDWRAPGWDAHFDIVMRVLAEVAA
ncbi:MAG: glycosyltransferase family 1 protein [Pseudomonadota bacterium]